MRHPSNIYRLLKVVDRYHGICRVEQQIPEWWAECDKEVESDERLTVRMQQTADRQTESLTAAAEWSSGRRGSQLLLGVLLYVCIYSQVSSLGV